MRPRVASGFYRELPQFWAAFQRAGIAGKALQLILFFGQRPGEVTQLVGATGKTGSGLAMAWNKDTHRVWLPHPVQVLLGKLPTTGLLLLSRGGALSSLDDVMRSICKELRIAEKVTPHDLRRTHGSTIAGPGFGGDAMNRIQNHREGGIADVYDQHKYATGNKRIMEAVAAHLLNLAEGRRAVTNVIDIRSR
jgi:integrase